MVWPKIELTFVIVSAPLVATCTPPVAAVKKPAPSPVTSMRPAAVPMLPAFAVSWMFPVVVTWLNDTGAFVVGKAIGGRKLMPSVSPGKTIAGTVGGVVTSAVAAWAYAALVRLASLPGDDKTSLLAADAAARALVQEYR